VFAVVEGGSTDSGCAASATGGTEGGGLQRRGEGDAERSDTVGGERGRVKKKCSHNWCSH
jgi:hypothetical protein